MAALPTTEQHRLTRLADRIITADAHRRGIDTGTSTD